ncbi:MAG: hypothetical protein DHS20C14_12230 [Phycisphaeraceae bacterium]|nr:MAG: hypothetical protein DHS20C14_12230 [Phycisphaeraceae bacterium]
MGAVFGIFGNATRDQLEAMGHRLSHRGGVVAIKPVDSAGWLGVVTHEPASRMIVVDGDGIACHASLYDAGDAVTALSAAVEGGGRDVERVDGDFALARMDARANRLTIARDFVGSFPLYCARTASGALAFASEYKALLALAGVGETPDVDALQFLQHGKRLPVGQTLLSGVWEAPPGCVMTLDASGETVEEHRFAPITPTGRVTGVRDACELIRERFEQAAVRRAGGDEPLGLALSGGIDSIAMAFLFRRLWPERRLLTFTAGSHGRDHEIVTARRVAEAVNAEHHEIITPASMLAETMPLLVWHMEDPYSRSETLQLFEIGRAAADAGLRVLHHAQGADGMFAGMPKYGLLALMNKYPFARKSLQEFYTFTQLGLPPRRTLARLGVWAKFRGSVAPVPRVIGGETPAPIEWPSAGAQFMNRVTGGGFQKGVCQDVHKFERPWAAFGVEARTPNHDMDYVRAAFSIDDRLKIRDGQQKWIFRRAMEPCVPEEFRRIPKFPQRMEANLELADALDAMTDKMLSPADVRERGIFAPGSVESLRRSDRSKPYSHEGGMRLWTAIMTELWARAFVDLRGEPPEPLGAHAQEPIHG